MDNKLLNLKRERDSSEGVNDKFEDSNEIFGKKIKLEENREEEKEINNKEESKEKLNENIQKMDISKNSILSIKEEEKEEDEEERLAELVFQLNSKNTGIECFICKKDLTKNIKFLCQKCNNQIFCIKCLIYKKHSTEHEFQIIDNLNYPLFTDDWKMNEEYKLLKNLSISGLNNWEDISNIMGNRGQVECESHYYSFYYTEKDNPNPKESSIIIDDNKKIIEEKLEINKKIEKKKLNEYQMNKGSIPEPSKEVKAYKRNGRYLCLRKNMKNGGAESAAEILGCRPKRNEFETEFLNDTEIEISHLEFDDENDKEEEKKIKFDVLKDYNLRIKEREERKKFVFEKGLLDLRRQNRIESKLSRDEFELLLFLKPFARFYENSEFFDLFEGISIEQELKLMLKNINKLEKEKNSKGEKICSIEEIENYFDIDKNINRTRKSGHLFTNIGEPKNIMNLLGHRVERFLDYQKETNGNNNQNLENKIFDDDEYQFIKEMPLASSTFYDIKKRAKNLLKKYNEKEKFSQNFNELLAQYDLESQTKEDILTFYKKKFSNFFIDNNNIKNSLRSNNLDNSSYISNILNNNNEKLINENNFNLNDELNNHNKKINNYQELKLNFNNQLENEISNKK